MARSSETWYVIDILVADKGVHHKSLACELARLIAADGACTA
jgi:hypothetical protein